MLKNLSTILLLFVSCLSQFESRSFAQENAPLIEQMKGIVKFTMRLPLRFEQYSQASNSFKLLGSDHDLGGNQFSCIFRRSNEVNAVIYNPGKKILEIDMSKASITSSSLVLRGMQRTIVSYFLPINNSDKLTTLECREFLVNEINDVITEKDRLARVSLLELFLNFKEVPEFNLNRLPELVKPAVIEEDL